MDFHAEASAPGKCILFGEHAVVYGATALAGALSDSRITATTDIFVPPPTGVPQRAGRTLHLVACGGAAASDDAPPQPPHPGQQLDESGVCTLIFPDVASGGVDSVTYQVAMCALSAGWAYCLAGSAPGGAPTAALPAEAGEAGASVPHVGASAYVLRKPDAGMLALLETLSTSARPCDVKAVAPLLYLIMAVFAPYGQELLASRRSLTLRIHKCTLPIAAGLGSSAAFSVAAAASLLDARAKAFESQPAGVLVGVTPPAAYAEGGACAHEAPFAMPGTDALRTINEHAYAAEMLFHGAPSGLDNTVATYGGAIAYSRSPAAGTMDIVHLHAMPSLRILVTNTLVPKETSKLVAGVRVLHDKHPAIVRPLLDSINQIALTFKQQVERQAAKQGAQSDSWLAAAQGVPTSAGDEAAVTIDKLKYFHGFAGDGLSQDASLAEGTVVDSGDAAASSSPSAASAASGNGSTDALWLPELDEETYTTTKMLMRMNHSLLNALGVGHAALDTVASISAKYGGVTKLTGAGGGGCAITLLPPRQACVAVAPGAKVRVGDTRTDAAARIDVPAMTAELQAQGYLCFETCLGGSGVLVQF